MESLIEKLGSCFTAGSEPLMERRLFRLLTLAATALTLFVVIPANYLLGLSPDINAVTLVFGAVTFFFYWESCRRRYHITTFFFLFLLMLNLIWFANGASQGSVSLHFFSAFTYAMIFFRGRARWLLLGLALGNGAALIAAEPYFTHWIVPYRTPEDRLADLVASLYVSASCSSLMLWGVLTSYDREQRRLTSVNAELERTVEENRKLNEELDQRVRERTARLEAAMQEQESFSYSVSHDLRGPLRHINSYSAILEEECGGCLTPEARGYLERIRAASRRMGKLIDDLLDLSRIGRSELRSSQVNLSELCSVISYRLQESEPYRQVEFVVAPDLTVQGDQALLEQVLENLLDNAWKYTSRRRSSRIELGAVRIGGQRIYFVKDNGVGFDMAYKDHLFGAFQRLHGVEFEGTGIGLATVKRIIERHRGAVWAEAAVNEGATIYFTLP